MTPFLIALLCFLVTIAIVVTCKLAFTPPVKGYIIVTKDEIENTCYFFLEPINREELEHELESGKLDYVTFRVRRKK